jgi:transcriptional regulator with XRE-family HTH domain
MNDIAYRLEEILKQYHLTAAEFADKLGVQKSSISHLLSGRNKPSFAFLSKLGKAFPEINLTWFITGDGDIFDKPTPLSVHENVSDLENQSAETISNERSDALSSPDKKKLAKDDSNASLIKNIIMVFDDDTFKILKSRT